jgi:hypothetical protein
MAYAWHQFWINLEEIGHLNHFTSVGAWWEQGLYFETEVSTSFFFQEYLFCVVNWQWTRLARSAV